MWFLPMGLGFRLTKQTLYNQKSRWLKRLIKVATFANRTLTVHDTRVLRSSSRYGYLCLAQRLYALGQRGEVLYDIGFDSKVTPEWLHDIGDHLGLIETLSVQLHSHAEAAGYQGELPVYLNYKCTPQGEVRIG